MPVLIARTAEGQDAARLLPRRTTERFDGRSADTRFRPPANAAASISSSLTTGGRSQRASPRRGRRPPLAQGKRVSSLVLATSRSFRSPGCALALSSLRYSARTSMMLSRSFPEERSGAAAGEVLSVLRPRKAPPEGAFRPGGLWCISSAWFSWPHEELCAPQSSYRLDAREGYGPLVLSRITVEHERGCG
jgi:hypothetical protein